MDKLLSFVLREYLITPRDLRRRHMLWESVPVYE
jgi:hypothetical protein